MLPVVIDVRAAEDYRDAVHRAVQALVEGKLVAFPTETVYGLAASALDEQAVARLVEVKGRNADHPMALALKSAQQAFDYIPEMGRLAQRLARRCWPGPVTLVVSDTHPDSQTHRLSANVRQVVSPKGTVGLRVPDHQVILDVLRMLTEPLVLSSANLTGHHDAITAEDVIEAVGEKIDMVLDDGPCRFGRPSSVVRLEGDRYEIIRLGVVSEQALQRLAGMMILLVCTGNTCRSPMAEVICRDMLSERLGCEIDELDQRGIIVMSAGIAAMMGGGASREAVQAAAEMGMYLGDHGTQPISEPLVRHADVIYTMTRSHCEAITAQWPEAAERTMQLCCDGSDVSDPIGGPVQRYRQCADQIRTALEIRLGELDIVTT